MVEKLVKNGENEHVEFKSERRNILSLNKIVEAVVCLANYRGGYLLIGVEDNGTITGARRLMNESPDLLRAKIYANTRPRLWVNVWVENYKGKNVVIIEVPKRILTATTDGKYLRRGIEGDGSPSCLPMEPHEIISLLSYSAQKDFTAEVLGFGKEVLDAESIDLLLTTVRKSGEEGLIDLADDEILRILGIMNVNGNVTLAGVLTCGKEETIKTIVPFHEVIFNHFKGAELKEQRVYHGNLLKIFFELMRMHERYNRGIGEVIKNGVRYEIPLVDFEAYREAVSNALIHRDFAIAGAVSVNWYDDGRVLISNPGGFVEGVTLDNILSVTPYPRNPLLSEIFRRIGIVEKTGRGVDKIFVGQAKYGKPLPVWDVDSRHVALTFIGSKWDKKIALKLLGEDFLPEEILLLYHLYANNGHLQLSEVTKRIQRKKEEVIYFITRLEERNLLKRFDEDVAVPEKYEEKKRGTVGREEAIFKLLGEKGHISRADVVETLKISPSTALRILNKLIEKGVIVREGKGGASRYRLADKSEK